MIEDNIFLTYRPIKEKLIDYGFVSFSAYLAYEVDFFNDEYKAKILVDSKGKISGKVIENAFGEEYLPLRNESYHGNYVGEVREAYKAILLDIRDKCFHKDAFIFKQANRIAKAIYEKYVESPDFPFGSDKIKNYGVFRRKDNAKWYGLIMNIARRNLDKKESDERIDVINLKIREEQMEELTSIKGIYPSYHMNKKKWISIV